jgi:hypothetical protein
VQPERDHDALANPGDLGFPTEREHLVQVGISHEQRTCGQAAVGALASPRRKYQPETMLPGCPLSPLDGMTNEYVSGSLSPSVACRVSVRVGACGLLAAPATLRAVWPPGRNGMVGPLVGRIDAAGQHEQQR